jgi:hypothetical protein
MGIYRKHVLPMHFYSFMRANSWLKSNFPLKYEEYELLSSKPDMTYNRNRLFSKWSLTRRVMYSTSRDFKI